MKLTILLSVALIFIALTVNSQNMNNPNNTSFAPVEKLELTQDAPQFVKDYYDYYKTPRGYHVRSGNSNDGWNVTSNLPFINFKFFEYADELENAVMIVHGDKAHSFYFGNDALARLKGDNKEFVAIPDASHTDLYYRLDIIPFGRITDFFNKNFCK